MGGRDEVVLWFWAIVIVTGLLALTALLFFGACWPTIFGVGDSLSDGINIQMAWMFFLGVVGGVIYVRYGLDDE